MELAHTLIEHPQIPHGPVRILFTCDEEIGHGIDHVDLAEAREPMSATRSTAAGTGEIDTETFSADLATITVRGVNIHPVDRQGPDGERPAGRRGHFSIACRRTACRPKRPTAGRAFCIPTRSKAAWPR